MTRLRTAARVVWAALSPQGVRRSQVGLQWLHALDRSYDDARHEAALHLLPSFRAMHRDDFALYMNGHLDDLAARVAILRRVSSTPTKRGRAWRGLTPSRTETCPPTFGRPSRCPRWLCSAISVGALSKSSLWSMMSSPSGRRSKGRASKYRSIFSGTYSEVRNEHTRPACLASRARDGALGP